MPTELLPTLGGNFGILTKFFIFDKMWQEHKITLMSKIYQDFGRKIQLYRTDKGENVTETAKTLDLNRTYLSKVENGHIKPSKRLIDKMGSYYGLNDKQIEELYKLAGHGGKQNIITETQDKEVKIMDQTPQGTPQEEGAVEVSVPVDMPVLYSNAVFVTTDDYGVILDFAARLGSTGKHNVISRIGMSTQHAEVLLKVLKNNLEDHKSKKMRKLVA